MAKITVADGTVFEGTPAEIVEMARAFEVSAKESTTEFKEDDKVRVNADGEFEDVLSGAYGVVSCVLEGEQADGDDGYVFQVETDDGDDWFRAEDLELAEKPEEPREPAPLKVGNFITIKFEDDNDTYYGDITEGREYEVLSDDGALAFIDDGADIRSRHIREGLYTIVDKPAEPAPCPFAQFGAGDKVRLLSGGGEHPLSGYDNGSIYEVVSNNADNGGISGRLIKLKGGGCPQAYAKPDQLEKVTDADAAQAKAERKRSDVFTANGRKVNEYREGDIVKVIRCTTGHTVGTIGEVSDSETHHYPQVFAPYEKTGERMSLHSYVEPITFVENRLDRK